MAHDADNGEQHTRRLRCDCGRFECPDCRPTLDDDGNLDEARGWEVERANEMNRRIKWFLRQSWRDKVQHVVVSPPQDWATEMAQDVDDYKEMRGQAYTILRRVATARLGGAAIFHHGRIKTKWNHRHKGDDGPHFHIIGDIYLDPDAARAVEAETGWIVEGLGVRDDVFGTALYILSHASKWSGNPAFENTNSPDVVTWFGSMAYAHGSPPDDWMPPKRWCGACGEEIPVEEWYLVDYIGEPEDRPPPDALDEGVAVNPGNWRKVLPDHVRRDIDRYLDDLGLADTGDAYGGGVPVGQQSLPA